MKGWETGGSTGGKVIVGSAKPLYEQGVDDIVGKARENAEPRECRRGRRKACMHGFDCRRVFRGNAVVDCAVPREMNLTARWVLSYIGLSRKLDELEKHERRIEKSWRERMKSWRRLRKLLQCLRRLYGETKKCRPRSSVRQHEEVVVVEGGDAESNSL